MRKHEKLAGKDLQKKLPDREVVFFTARMVFWNPKVLARILLLPFS
jgi:hypothetical protein